MVLFFCIQNAEGQLSDIPEDWRIIDAENEVYLDITNDRIVHFELADPHYIFKESYANAIATISDKCYNGRVRLNPNNVIRKDCEESEGSFRFSNRLTCKENSCNYIAFVYFEGEQIAFKEIKSLTIIEEDYSVFDLSEIDTPHDAELRFVVIKSCLNLIGNGPSGYYSKVKVFDETKTMQVRSQGEDFELVEFLGVEILDTDCILTANEEDVLCCKDDSEIIFRLDDIEENTITNGFGIDLSLADLKYKINGSESTFGVSLNYSWSYNHSFSEVKVIRRNFTLKAQDGYCVYPGFQVYGRRYLVKTYELSCENNYDIFLSDRIEQVPFKIEPISCPVPTDCVPPIITIDPDPFQNDTAESRSLNCTGNINVEPVGNDFDDWTYYWEGPDNFTSDQQYLLDVPYGKYTLIVTNACCDEYVTTVFLCEELSYGDWELNSETGQYCRAVICSTCEEDIEDEECVYAEYTDYYFDEKTLTCNRDLVLGDGTIINFEVFPAEYEDSYDDFFEACVRTYYCDGSAEHEVEEDPQFTEWEYDDFFEECFRVVSCFEEEITEEEIDAEIEAEHSSGTCFLEVTCNGETVQEDEEDAEIEWDYNDFFDECEGTIICNDEEVDEITEDPEVEDVDYNTFSDLCEITVSCDGSATFEYEASPTSGEVIGQNEGGYDLCEVYCAFESTGVIVLCSDINFNPGDEVESREINKEELMKIAVYPNPFQNKLVVENMPKNRMLTISLTELISGKTVLRKGLISNSGQVNLSIDPAYNSGIYILQIHNVSQEVLFIDKILKVK